MTTVIVEGLFHLIMVLPIIILTLKEKTVEYFKVLAVFVIFFILHKALLELPIIYPELGFNQWSRWNWAGKIYAIIGSILFLLIYKKFPLKDYFLTIRLEWGFLKVGMLLVVFILVVQVILALFSLSKPFNLETLAFQFTMPGLDEELAYRGIMLGLLIKILNSKNLIFNPAVWITAILFGLAHGLSFSNELVVIFKFAPFFRTMNYGLIWGWLTIKSGSIVLALISHNLGNGCTNLIRMR